MSGLNVPSPRARGQSQAPHKEKEIAQVDASDEEDSGDGEGADSDERLPPRERTSQWCLGLSLLAVVVLIWTLSSVVVQHIYVDMHFNGPFFLTYIGACLFTVYLPVYVVASKIEWCSDRISGRKRDGHGDVEFTLLQDFDDEDLDDDEYVKDMKKIDTAASDVSGGSAPPVQFSVWETFQVSLFVCPLWFVAQYTYNASLQYTSITSNTVISSSSCLFTFFFAILFLGEKFTCTKLFCLLLCMGGVTVISLKDSSSGQAGTLWGDEICIFSAFMYGSYTTAIRKKIPHDNACSMPLFFGFLGLACALLMAPVAVWMVTSKTEPLDALTSQVIMWLVLKGLFQNVLADMLWARAMILTSPTVATIALSLTIPAAMVSDFLLGKALPSAHSVIGALLVVSGFLSYTYVNSKEESNSSEESSSKYR